MLIVLNIQERDKQLLFQRACSFLAADDTTAVNWMVAWYAGARGRRGGGGGEGTVLVMCGALDRGFCQIKPALRQADEMQTCGED